MNVEDILTVQTLYGSKDNENVPNTTSVVSTTTVATTTTSANDWDLCKIQWLDKVLMLNHRLFIAHQHRVWFIDIRNIRYSENNYFKDVFVLSDYAIQMEFLPANFTCSSAIYQRPSGDIALFVGKSIYMVEYPSYSLKMGWPKTIADIGLPRNARINAAINSYSERTYVIYNNDKVAQIDECNMTAVKHNLLQDIFPGIPSGIMTAYRHHDGNLYFFVKPHFYAFNKFTNNVIKGPFNLSVLGIYCHKERLVTILV